jgi:hypothetical protein
MIALNRTHPSINAVLLLCALSFITSSQTFAKSISRDQTSPSKKKMLQLDFSSNLSNKISDKKDNSTIDTYVDTSAEDKKRAERALITRRNTLENKYAKTEVSVRVKGGESSNTRTSSSHGLLAFSILAELDQTKSLVTHKDGGDQSSLDYAIYPTFTFNKWIRLKFGLEGTQNQRDSEKSQLNSVFSNLSTTPLAMTDFFDWSPSISLSLPVNKDQIDRKSMQASSSLGLTLMINQDQLPKSLSAGVLLLFGKYFYEYSTSTAGDVNTDYSMRQVLYGNLQISKWLSVYGEFHHIWQVNFESNGTDGFDSKEEIAISPYDNWSFLLGHTNGGSVFKADGMSNNVSLINENSSMMYLGVRAKF